MSMFPLDPAAGKTRTSREFQLRLAEIEAQHHAYRAFAGRQMVAAFDNHTKMAAHQALVATLFGSQVQRWSTTVQFKAVQYGLAKARSGANAAEFSHYHSSSSRDATFSEWVRNDPVGATLSIAKLLEDAYGIATAEVSASQITLRPMRSLREAQTVAEGMALRLAEATGESLPSPDPALREQVDSVELAPQPLMPSELALEANFPGRARTRRWLENLPVAQLGVLGHELNRARNEPRRLLGVDQTAAQEVFARFQHLNTKLVASAAEIVFADPRLDIPQAALERMAHTPSKSPEFAPEQYVKLINEEVERLRHEALRRVAPLAYEHGPRWPAAGPSRGSLPPQSLVPPRQADPSSSGGWPPPLPPPGAGPRGPRS